jgi:hypothetical protein
MSSKQKASDAIFEGKNDAIIEGKKNSNEIEGLIVVLTSARLWTSGLDCRNCILIYLVPCQRKS